ncbi:MAG: ABC transporter ATP-binding protein [Candidatus Pacebacteria bacterium]|nr:ABC transporter ATP-binding protein [Candidatus Paceibacterota bacterium]
MLQIIKYFKPYLLWLLVLVFFVAGQSYVNLTLPDYTARIVNEGVSRQDLGIIYSVGAEMLLITLLGGLFTVSAGFLAAKISTGYARRLREATFTKVESFSLDEFNNFSSSSLITRATNDIQQLQNVLGILMRMTFMAPLMGVGAVIKANQLAPSMSWIIFYAIGFLIAVLLVLFVLAIPKFTVIQQLVDKLGLEIREMLVGVRVIRAYGKDSEVQEKFSEANQESTRLNIFVARLISIVSPVMTLLMGLTGVAVVWVGAYLVDGGALDIGHIVALMQYISQAIFSFFMLSIVFIMIPRAAVSVRRISEILEVKPRIKDPETSERLPDIVRGNLEFRDVSFSYEGSEQPILNDISFVARPGETTAIVGGTGSGKSTLLNLIPRLYDVTAGSVTLDGVDIRHITQHELRKHIGYIPQKAALFSGTVKSNIAYGAGKAEEGEIEKAAAIAQATEFIGELPQGFENPIAQGGTNLSGGQKQRLSIARALAKKSPVILFDDSFSALDYRTDAALRGALRKELKNSTIIIVAQRISTIMNADNIIVLDNGKIVGQGRHEDLLKSCPVYQEIAASQLSAEELNIEK